MGCHKLLRYDPGTLANHASHAHDLSMEDFYDAFFKPEESEGLFSFSVCSGTKACEDQLEIQAWTI